MTGTVTLVGGGPGDPGLITVAGLAALRVADVVLYDHLAPLACLDECRPDAELVDVGKIPGGRTTSQERINELLVEHALAGREVVRFKGGDSFVFGRGGEEVLACAAAGVAVRVIPGVTSAVAGPALAGIPVTHRGVVQAFTVVSGHVGPDHPTSTTDWSALARAGHTLVVLMGVATLGAICTRLIEDGLAADTPAAVVVRAGSPEMRVLRGTVTTIPGIAADARVLPPAITVIGQVADLGLPVPTQTAAEVSGSIPGTLRRATANDVAELVVLQRACWSQEAIDNDSLGVPALHEDAETVTATLAAWETWVLRRSGRLIGAVRGQLRGSDWEVGRLMVAPDLAGQGLGRQLLAHIEGRAPAAAQRFVLYTGQRSHRNLRFYQQAGYTLLGDEDPWLPPVPVTVRLAKPRP